LVQLWQRQQTRKRKSASTNQLLDWYSKAYITVEDLRNRLLILGWQGADILLLLHEGDEKLQQRIAKAELQHARTVKQQIDAIKRMEREEEARAKAALSHLMSIETPARLTQWFKLGEISADEISSKLIRFGWPQEDILRFLISIGA
jgi:hypothetical protein